tara:strand:+ start:3625 stop:3894 length:270 start_codon:yes stop_codon:yes gene_type:complete
MADVVQFLNNDLELQLREIAIEARNDRIDYCLVISQKEVDGYLEWCIDEMGEKSTDQDHIRNLLGHLFSYSQQVFLEMITSGDQEEEDA